MSASASHQTVRLARGRHQRPEDGVCVMELASMLAGEPFTDRPRTVCRVIAAVLRCCNDRFDSTTRQLLFRYAADSVGTAGNARVSATRVGHCAEAVRGRIRHGWILRWMRRAITPPEDPLGPELEGFAADVVRSYPKSPEGARELLALVDELLAIRPEPAIPAIDRPVAPTPSGLVA